MQEDEKAKFLKFHHGQVRSVAFNPKDRYLFCSGGNDGKVNLYSALRGEFLMSYHIMVMTLAKSVNAVRFTNDGSKILVATSAKRLAVVDVERGEQVLAYDNCVFTGRERAAIAPDPISPSVAVCVTVSGKGLTLLDLRLPLPLDFLYDVHSCTIRDVTFLHSSWPWTCGHQRSLLTVATDGSCKVSAYDGRLMHSFHAGQMYVNTVCPTPEAFNHFPNDGFQSLVACGGNGITSYTAHAGVTEKIREKKHNCIWKLRYTANGGFLYSVSSDGKLRKYRRYPQYHQYLGVLYAHKSDILDLDISPYDEYIITASSDKTVGIMRLGTPNRGCTDYYELT